MSSGEVLCILRFVFVATTIGTVLVSALFLSGLLAPRPTELDLTVLLATSAGGATVSWWIILRR